MNKVKLLLTLCIVFGLSTFVQPAKAKQKVYTTGDPAWITIIAHGSFSLRPHLTIRNILRMLNDTIEESVYYRSTEINRRDPFFYKNQAMAGLGLHKIDISHPNKTYAAPIVGALFEDISQYIGNPPSDQYYTFGWSGLVSNKLRYIEAGFLYNDISKVVQQIKSEGKNPKVRIIGYSHGGNLALQLGALHITKPTSEQFTIDELILLGTPIQVETDYLINSPVFKRVYNLYSEADSVQPLDFFSFKRFFSQRKFHKRRNFKLPEKLVQVGLKVSGYKPRTKLARSMDKLTADPTILRKHFKEINYEPGHFELWFMGWTILTFRQKFPTHPLPILTFLPMIINYVDQAPLQDLVVHLKPTLNQVNLYPYRKKKEIFAQHPFVPFDKLKQMQDYALSFRPQDYNIATYNRKVYDAIDIAHHEKASIRKLIKLERKKKKIPEIINLHKDSTVYQGHFE